MDRTISDKQNDFERVLLSHVELRFGHLSKR